MKDMPVLERGPRGPREGGTAIFQAGPTRVIVDGANKVTGVEFIRMRPGAPDASGRRRPEPAPEPSSSSTATASSWPSARGPDLSWIGPGNEGVAAVKWKLGADAVTFETGRPGVFRRRRRPNRGRHRRSGGRRGPALRLRRRRVPARGNDLSELRQRQTLAEVEPVFLSIVPYTDEPKEARHASSRCRQRSGPRANVEYEIPYTAAEVMAESTRCLQCTCEGDRQTATCAPGDRVRDHSTDAGTGPRPGTGFRSVTENRFTGANHDYIRDRQPRLHPCASRPAGIDCGRCAQVCADVVGAACYDFMRTGFDTLVTTPLDMS